MAEYRNRSSGEIKTDTELRAANKNMSFPKVWNSSVYDALNVDPVLEAPAPAPSAPYKSVVRNGAVEDGKGNWVYAWVEREMFTEYTDKDGKVQTVAAQKTAYDTANTAALAADVLYTDVWASMGEENQKEKKDKDFQGFTIDRSLVEKADKDAIILHCLPAYRSKEITDEVIESKKSRIFDQAENRMHVQQALLSCLLF